MPLARIGATLLFFVHIPKTGGTSVEAYLRAKGAVLLHGAGAGWARVPVQHLHRDAYAEFVDPAHRLFRLEDGLDPVLRWIDAATATPAAPGTFHERRSAPIPVACSAATDALIRDFYREDYALIARLAA